MLCIIVIHNFAVLGLFALENITMAEMFGSRNRFTRMAISKEAGGLVAVGFGPLLAGIFCNMTGSWWPIVAMLVAYSVIGLISAILMPEVRDRDLSAAQRRSRVCAERDGRLRCRLLATLMVYSLRYLSHSFDFVSHHMNKS